METPSARALKSVAAFLRAARRRKRRKRRTPMHKKNKLDDALVNPVAEGVHQVRPKGGDATEQRSVSRRRFHFSCCCCFSRRGSFFIIVLWIVVDIEWSWYAAARTHLVSLWLSSKRWVKVCEMVFSLVRWSFGMNAWNERIKGEKKKMDEIEGKIRKKTRQTFHTNKKKRCDGGGTRSLSI